MSFNAASLRLMEEKGLSLADVIEIAAAMESRSKAAERQSRYRRRKAERDVTDDDVTGDVTLVSNESISNLPASETKVSSADVKPRARKPDLFVCPEGVQAAHWRDFMANRKRKHCATTETAYQLILSDLAKHADEDWPPGRLVQHAAGKGWASINDPRTSLGNQQNGHHRSDNLRGSRPSPALDMFKRAAAEEAAERGDQAADRGAWPEIPSLGSG